MIEAIAERMDWKLDLYERIAPHVAPHALVASNTSGCRSPACPKALPESIRPRFCGIHFFNPPRYMALVELIATPTTQPAVLDQLETFVTSTLGKSVVRAKDTPNFIANRVGHRRHAGHDQGGRDGPVLRRGRRPDGKKMGRASSGTFRTADVVGLDTMAHVIKTLQDNLARAIRSSPATPPRRCSRPDRQGRAGPEDRRGLLPQEGGQDILRLTRPKATTSPPAARPTPSSPASQEGARRAPEAAARVETRRPSSCGPSCATASTTPPCTWPSIADNARDVDFARCAGASA